MSSSSDIVSLALTAAASFLLGAIVLLSSGPGFATDRKQTLGAVELPPPRSGNQADNNNAGTCSCPGNTTPPASNSTPLDPQQRQKLWPKPSLADIKSQLDDTDAIAALEAVQITLTEVGDGATYVWHRWNGRLSGTVQPTTSFKDSSGQVCRHLVMALTSGNYSRKAEGIACRQRNGVWILEG
jgi:surface antigen